MAKWKTVLWGLAGAGAGGIAGGLIGGLIGLGFHETEAKFIDKKLGSGSVLLGVETPSERRAEVKRLFEELDADSVTIH